MKRSTYFYTIRVAMSEDQSPSHPPTGGQLRSVLAPGFDTEAPPTAGAGRRDGMRQWPNSSPYRTIAGHGLMRCRRTLRQARRRKRCARSVILIYPILRASNIESMEPPRGFVATDTNQHVASQALLRAEHADARLVKQRVQLQAFMPCAPVWRCAAPGLRARPTSATVTFLNGRNCDISIW